MQAKMLAEINTRKTAPKSFFDIPVHRRTLANDYMDYW